MIWTLVKLRLFKGDDKRSLPIQSGYRPLFEFSMESRVSGHIELINRCSIDPGESDEVAVYFRNDDHFGDSVIIGKKFLFYEGKEPLGEVEILSQENSYQ